MRNKAEMRERGEKINRTTKITGITSFQQLGVKTSKWEDERRR